jgi:hypothetical protein
MMVFTNLLQLMSTMMRSMLLLMSMKKKRKITVK